MEPGKTRTDSQNASHPACVNMQLLRTSHYVLKAYDHAYRDLGVRATQTPVLGILARKGSATIREIADEMESERSVMSRKLKVMEANGWVQQEMHTREKAFALTEDGRQLMEQVWPIRLKVQNEILSKLTREEQQLMFSLCDKLK